MAYSVNWVTKVITIPVSDLTLVSGTRYSLSMSDFLIETRRLEAGFSDGLWASQILDHTNPKLDFAGADYAGFDEVTGGYTITFASPATRVDLLGSNNNIIDVLNVTGVSVVPSNSAGLQVVRQTGVPERATAWPNFAFNLVLSSDHASPAIGKAATITVRICKDDGAWAVISPTITEVGQGQYRIDLTAADMDFQTGTLMFSEPDADPIKITIRTAGA